MSGVTVYDGSLDKIIELYNSFTDDNVPINELLEAYYNNENQLRED